jgi:bifunctional DNA-binding transcriptional regulator/antitoxin component of YhaV-PrlF toxin-antitoxin module
MVSTFTAKVIGSNRIVIDHNVREFESIEKGDFLEVTVRKIVKEKSG